MEFACIWIVGLINSNKIGKIYFGETSSVSLYFHITKHEYNKNVILFLYNFQQKLQCIFRWNYNYEEGTFQ